VAEEHGTVAEEGGTRGKLSRSELITTGQTNEVPNLNCKYRSDIAVSSESSFPLLLLVFINGESERGKKNESDDPYFLFLLKKKRKKRNPNEKKMTCRALLTLFVLVAVVSHGALASKCPKNWNATQGACRNLNATIYKGVWYEQFRSASFVWDFACYCTTARYTIDTLPAYIGVHNDCNTGRVGGNQTGFNGEAGPVLPEFCGLAVAFFGLPPGKDVNYQVLDTDYENYSIVITCDALQHDLDLEQIWVLSRVPIMSDSLKATLLTRLSNWGFDFSDRVPTVQGAGCTGQGY
jgi:lipocalin